MALMIWVLDSGSEFWGKVVRFSGQRLGFTSHSFNLCFMMQDLAKVKGKNKCPV
jgi:hypothetical protein